MNDNRSYKLPSDSTVDTLTATDADIGSLPSPLAKVSPGRNTIGGKKATVRLTRKGTLTESESEDEPTPFKKVVGERWKESVEDMGADFTEEPIRFEGVVREHFNSVEEPTQLEGLVDKKGKGKALTHSDSELVQPVPRPRPRPLKMQAESSTPAPAPTKPALKLDASNDLDTDAETSNSLPPKPLKQKPSKPKSDAVKAKEALKSAQGAVRRAKEEQKRA